jgi:head-tail adaptor
MAMPMPPGRGAAEYNNYATIQKNNPDVKPSGQLAQDWDGPPFGHAWCQVLPRGGRERRVFEQLRAEVTHIVRFRKNTVTAGVRASGFRLYFKGSGLILNITSKVEIDTRGLEYQCECEEVQQ